MVRCGLKGAEIHYSFPLATLHWLKNAPKWVSESKEEGPLIQVIAFSFSTEALPTHTALKKQIFWKRLGAHNNIQSHMSVKMLDRNAPYDAITAFVLTLTSSCSCCSV